MDEKIFKSAAELRSAYPGLVDQILNEAKNTVEVKAEIVELKNQVQVLTDSETELKGQVVTLTEADVVSKTTIETLTNEKAALEKERDEYKTKVDEFDTATKIAQWDIKVQAAIDESKIDKKLVSDVFLSDLKKKETIEEVEALIEDRKSLTVGAVILNADDKKIIKKEGEENAPTVKTDEELAEAISA